MVDPPTSLNESPRLRQRIIGLAIGVLLLIGCFLVNLVAGTAKTDFNTVWNALFAFNDSTEQVIIRTARLPRALIAPTVGAALAVAGALMQGLTRNPLSDSGLLGINAGAALAVVATTVWLGNASMQLYVWVAFIGAAIAAVAVYFLGSLGRRGMTPLKLILAGAVLSYLLAAFTTGLLILSERTLEEIRFWLAGSVAGRSLEVFWQVFPYAAIGFAIAFSLGRQMTALSLGEDVARGLGLRIGRVKVMSAIAVVLLAGGAVALAGPIAFVGLVVPHLVRFWVGVDYQWLLPYAAIWGAILLSLADLAARWLLQPQELPVGVMTTLLGGPFFIYLARSRVKS
ncbi:iron ABC transporter, permease protein (plasmid) [Leptolyngbya sp. NIES-3755]|nr:iron ABC transporter, permease protein [Leptolyngbya sp. NIES-3755]